MIVQHVLRMIIPVRFQNGNKGKFWIYSKITPYKNGKGLAHRFCQKMKIVNPLRFLVIIVLNVPLEFFAVGQILKNLKIPTLWQKWQGVISFFFLNMNFIVFAKKRKFSIKGSPFSFQSIHDSPNMSLERL